MSKLLKDITPAFSARRLQLTRQYTNPHPYYAQYPGHKLHMDQNEKLQQYGVCEVAAIDGFSRKIMRLIPFSIKNNLAIYSQIYQPIVSKYSMWDTLRTDYGKEFYLCLYVQDNLSQQIPNLRRDPTRAPYKQTTSKRNLKAERVWPEVNQRVNYPLETALHNLVDEDLIDMEDATTKYCVSTVTRQVASYGLNNLVQSWNSHSVRGVGIPNELFANTWYGQPVPQDVLPSPQQAAQEYQSHGGRLTPFGQFGSDPIANNVILCQMRDEYFARDVPNIAMVMSCAGFENYVPFQEAVLKYIHITENLLQYN